jgi:hypothetical protein
MWKLVPEFTPKEITEKYTPEYIAYLESKISLNEENHAKD